MTILLLASYSKHSDIIHPVSLAAVRHTMVTDKVKMAECLQQFSKQPTASRAWQMSTTILLKSGVEPKPCIQLYLYNSLRYLSKSEEK